MTSSAITGLPGGAPTTATYITQTPSSGLSAEQALSLLGTGVLKNTTGTGALSIATPEVDYYSPTGAAAWQWVETQTATADSSLDFVSWNTGFTELLFVCEGLYASTGTNPFSIRTSVNASTYATTGYQWCDYLFSPSLEEADVVSSGNGGSDTHLWLTRTSSAVNTATISGFMHVVRPTSAPDQKGFLQASFQYSNASLVNTWGLVLTTVNGIRFMFTGGNITAGTITLYGLVGL